MKKKNIPVFLSSLPETCHLIVVDASDDRTVEVIRELRPDRTRILHTQSTIPEARQIGAEMATTEWLLFTDADVVFPAGYFENLARYGTCDCIYGAKLSSLEYRKYYRSFAYGQQLSHLLGVPAATGSNLVIRKGVVADVGGFDLHLVCNEDSELVWRIKRNGHRVVFAADLPVYATDHRRLQRGMLRKTLHSMLRCSLLYLDLIPDRWRSQDWGYWSEPRKR